jgi:hypothetical protein
VIGTPAEDESPTGSAQAGGLGPTVRLTCERGLVDTPYELSQKGGACVFVQR